MSTLAALQTAFQRAALEAEFQRSSGNTSLERQSSAGIHQPSLAEPSGTSAPRTRGPLS
ncbi:hypothetical protein ACFY8C_39605 [Streptomyces flavochromogenes]|uniref:Uncharacterized protein n=1 Tax=Streptomyces flavochromogenes TaxID=68199 RepID=A0ABW6Y3J4_9ACTN|nr:hypothetical protein [Streptomyces flavochromogenes]